jgi:hypothetical protein
VSQFKNLFHHFVHQHSNEEASTFWSGCGAVRRQAFLEAGGFDAVRYDRPCIEDIELGYRLREAGHRIRLLKNIQVKHLKRWSLRDMVRTDVFDRGVPWTILLLEKKQLPNDLNLQLTQRLSGMLSYSILLYAGLIAYFHSIFMLPFVAALFLMVAGSMDWSDKTLPFHMISRRAEWICYGLIGVVLSLAFVFDVTRMYLPLSLLFFGMIGGRLLPLSSRLGRRFFFSVVLAGLAATVAVLLSRFSFPVVAPLLVAVLLVVLLNFPLYHFFTKKRGLVFAMVALPMHLFYFSYALVSLGIGTARFLLGDGRRRVATKAV